MWDMRAVGHSGFLRCHLYVIARSVFFPIPEILFWVSFGKGIQAIWKRKQKRDVSIAVLVACLPGIHKALSLGTSLCGVRDLKHHVLLILALGR